MYYCAISLGVLENTPQISCHLCDLVCFGVHFNENIYNYLDNIYIYIYMVLLQTSCRYGPGGFLEYYF